VNTYGVIGGTLWGNRGAEAMVVTTIGRVRERDPGASFVLLSYYPERDRALLADPGVTVVGATPRHAVVTWLGALLCRALRPVGVRVPDAVLPGAVRALRGCRALFDVSGISFHDDRLPVVVYNVLSAWPAFLLKVPVVRLAQAMGPFRHPLNRLPARWVTRRSLHTFARGRRTAAFMERLGAPAGSWSVAPDVAFAYQPEYSLTSENDERVAAARAELATARAAGTDVVGLVPSSLVNRKIAGTGGDYVGLLRTLVGDLQRRGAHVLVMPNATRAGVAAGRNNDITVITQLRDRIAADPSGVDPAAITYIDVDVNTASIRSLAGACTLLITSRFHAMVAALALGVPPLVMGWSHKYEEVLEMFGCEANAVDFSAAEREVPALVGRLLDDHEKVQERIVKALPEVTAAAVAQFDQLDRLPPPR
jgi:polysaccharide pyruvyl transferase WcaK-like protein